MLGPCRHPEDQAEAGPRKENKKAGFKPALLLGQDVFGNLPILP
jgi:hypothetical protein